VPSFLLIARHPQFLAVLDDLLDYHGHDLSIDSVGRELECPRDGIPQRYPDLLKQIGATAREPPVRLLQNRDRVVLGPVRQRYPDSARLPLPAFAMSHKCEQFDRLVEQRA
jgi:hypothetical protein